MPVEEDSLLLYLYLDDVELNALDLDLTTLHSLNLLLVLLCNLHKFKLFGDQVVVNFLDLRRELYLLLGMAPLCFFVLLLKGGLIHGLLEYAS